MPWTTPKVWTVEPVGLTSLNNIENNLKYLREENKIINGTNTLTGQLIVSASGIDSSSASVDILKPVNVTGSGKFNNSVIGEWVTNSGFARFGHNDFNASTNYGFLQRDNSDVYISGGLITLANTTTITGLLTVSASGITSSSASVDILKPVNVTGSGKFNNAVIGEWVTNAGFARFGHNDFNTSTNYGFLQNSNDDVYISGGLITLANTTTINGRLTVSSSGITSSSTSVNILKPTVIGGGAWDTINTLQVTGSASITGGVNTDNVTVKNRLYTGVLDAGGYAIVSSGITPAKILSIRCYFFSGTTWFLLRNPAEDENNFIDASGIISCRGNSIHVGLPYRMYVTYEA